MRFLFFFLIVGFLASCGPEQTARQAEKDEAKSIVNEQKAYLDRIEGNYEGYVIAIDGKSRVVAKLTLRSFSTFAPVPNRLELIEIPNMIGFLELGPDSAGIWTGFNTGVYDSDENVLKMMGSRDDSAIVVFMQVHVDGNRLWGEIFRGKLNQRVEFTRKI